MSKKIEAIKGMVFYSQQNPEKLATVIAGLVSDVASKVSVSGADSITIPEADAEAVTSTYTASVFSQYGDTMTGQTVAFSLKAEVTGVSISTDTGVVTVADSATADSFVVVATCGSVVGEKTVTLVASN